jgi:hypothetical protein
MSPQVGKTMTTTNGTWGGTQPFTFTYQWFRDSTAVAGATGSSYTVTSADVGHHLSVGVQATNSAGKATEYSSWSAVVPSSSSTTPPTTTTTTDPSTSPPTTGPSVSGKTLVFDDEFNGSSLSNLWYPPYSGVGNEGVGTRSPSTVSVSGGSVNITDHGTVGGGFMSSHSFLYGTFTVRFRQDLGTGYGPAIMLWPSNGVWPSGGELDLAEVPYGNRAQAVFTDHYGSNNSIDYQWMSGNFSQWNVITLVWEPSYIQEWLNGTLVKSITNRAEIPTTAHSIVVQNDVGCSSCFIPAPNSSSPAYVALHVDYVQVYQP